MTFEEWKRLSPIDYGDLNRQAERQLEHCWYDAQAEQREKDADKIQESADHFRKHTSVDKNIIAAFALESVAAAIRNQDKETK